MDREKNAISNNGRPESNQDIVQSFLAIQEDIYTHYTGLPHSQRQPGSASFWLFEEASRFGQHAATGQIIGHTRTSENPIPLSLEDTRGLTEFFHNVLHIARQESNR